jgi:hypothetical protein
LIFDEQVDPEANLRPDLVFQKIAKPVLVGSASDYE